MKIDLQELPHILVTSFLEVHKAVGPDLVRDAYLECVAQELLMREIFYDRNVAVAIDYKGRRIPNAFQFDFVVEHLVAVDVQTFPEDHLDLKERHKERLNTMLRLSGLETGFLVNFRSPDLRKGIKRLIVSGETPAVRYR